MFTPSKMADQLKKNQVFARLCLPASPVILAPLAGVSDHPFRRVCMRHGADLSYVEMISAAALLFENRRTLEMMKRHESETKLGVQITGRSAEETARAIEKLDKMPFDTIDINMGCPVTKVVKTGCGSAILKDPKRVFETVRLARAATGKVLTVKIRLGWDHNSINALEVSEAAASAGAEWITVHGRTRSDDYSVAVDLGAIAQVAQNLSIPVIGNGNLFCPNDAELMGRRSGVSGFMISRGALGDPWIFSRLKGRRDDVTPEEWTATVMDHLGWQEEEYGSQGAGAVCMRKHLLWYLKGWPNAKAWKDAVSRSQDLNEAKKIIAQMGAELLQDGVSQRFDLDEGVVQDSRFSWDPKWEMDRQLDRGVGTEGLLTP